jgi:hypothetical protein
VLSFGYFSLHKQRTSDSRPKGVKALDVDVDVAFNKQQIKRKSSGASSALRDHCHLHESPWIPAYAGMTVDRWRRR